MLKEYFKRILEERAIENLKKYSRSESELKLNLENHKKSKKFEERPEYCVRKKGLSNLYPIILDGWIDICYGLYNTSNDTYCKKCKYYIKLFLFKISVRIIYYIQRLWMWRNNLVLYIEYGFPECEQVIDEDGNPCLYYRKPPRTGKLKRIWNKLTFGVNDD